MLSVVAPSTWLVLGLLLSLVSHPSFDVHCEVSPGCFQTWDGFAAPWEQILASASAVFTFQRVLCSGMILHP